MSTTLSALALALLLAGCAALSVTVNGRPERAPPAGVTVATGSIRSSTGCRLGYRLYRPQRDTGRDLVVLGHGFLRSQARMAGLAEALAADGIPVATLDYCNMHPWNGRHVQNGLDMIALADALGAERVVYAGFSAGALAALVAGREDPRTAGIVTLDLVDADGIGRRAARGLDKPLLGLAGEPTNCNAHGNARAVFAASDEARVRHIPGAGHCDFEAPTDSLCELLCEEPDGPAPPKRKEIISAAKRAVQTLFEPKKSS